MGDASNIQEFNQIAGLIFAQLYKAFPCNEDIDKNAIAGAMGIPALNGGNWETHKLASGRSFNEMLSNTIGWLNHQEYIKAFGAHPAQRVILADRGLKAMNVTPSALATPVGTALTSETDRGASRDLSKIGDLIGGVFGGIYKSLGSG